MIDVDDNIEGGADVTIGDILCWCVFAWKPGMMDLLWWIRR